MSELPKASTVVERIILITTTDLTAGRSEELERLICSIAAFRCARPLVQVDHHILIQRCDDAWAAKSDLHLPSESIVSAVPNQLPLSIARNCMLDTLVDLDKSFDSAIIAFPDDDAWFPEGTLEYIYGSFGMDPELDLLFCHYGSDAQLPANVNERTASLQNAISNASSNTIFLRGRIVRAIGGFDEGLGLGTPAKSGEDTEFAIRAYYASSRVKYLPHRLIGHRDFDKSIRARYYAGGLVALGRHATFSPAGVTAFARKVLVGMALAGKRDLTLTGLTGAWKLLVKNRVAPNLVSTSKGLSGIIPPARRN